MRVILFCLIAFILCACEDIKQPREDTICVVGISTQPFVHPSSGPIFQPCGR